MHENLPTLLSALVGDVFGAKGWLWGNVAGAGFAFAAERLLRRRTEQARDILLDELRRGEKPLTVPEVDEAVAVLLRYGRAAQEGAARLNLRLLAKVITGQMQHSSLYADEFLRHAETLAHLRREEIILLGTMQRCWNHKSVREIDDSQRLGTFRANVGAELIPKLFKDEDEMQAMVGAVARTGLLLLIPGWDGTSFQPTRTLARLCEIAPFEAALEAEPA